MRACHDPHAGLIFQGARLLPAQPTVGDDQVGERSLAAVDISSVGCTRLPGVIT
jgi:hypothetical protein